MLKRKKKQFMLILCIFIFVGSLATCIYNDMVSRDDDIFNLKTSAITITSPTTSSSWQAGSTQTITWNPQGGKNVIISLYYLDSLYNTIIVSTPNNGSFPWTLDATYPYYGNKYRIYIVENLNPSNYGFSYYFEITEATGQTASQAVPGYDLFILIGVIGLISIFFVKKYRK
ncbi:MAG: Ser-Thr-rich GPI-anchored membrane family protein [Promethearchaeota archaeon]